MIHPLVPFAIRGITWYQGEQNNGDGMLYFDKMQALIQSWRNVVLRPDAPFYFVQIAP
jgi:sialate O-acetylesterase